MAMPLILHIDYLTCKGRQMQKQLHFYGTMASPILQKPVRFVPTPRLFRYTLIDQQPDKIPTPKLFYQS
jgi:hypothetical protein